MAKGIAEPIKMPKCLMVPVLLAGIAHRSKASPLPARLAVARAAREAWSEVRYI